MRTWIVLLAAVLALLVWATPAAGDPADDPADDRAAEAGSLVARLSTAQAALDDVRSRLGTRQEVANRALADDAAARTRAEAAARAAVESRARADAAGADAERARVTVDAWLAASFQQADVLSPFPVLAGADDAAEVAERERLRAHVADEQRAALDTAELARIAAANEDSRARAARAEADRAATDAAGARATADAELARVRTEVDTVVQRVRSLTAERDAVADRLEALEDADPSLAAQRARAETFTEAAEARDRDADRRARDAARNAPTTRADDASDALAEAGVDADGLSPEVVTVLERALSQLGTIYAWGGGNADGPTKGTSVGASPSSLAGVDETGFDCSGLMIYAFAGAGQELQHYSGYQAEAGPRVPLAERRPGDMLFWAEDEGRGAVHHVALYLGDDRMVEAPETGKTVRITKVRFTTELLDRVTRPL